MEIKFWHVKLYLRSIINTVYYFQTSFLLKSKSIIRIDNHQATNSFDDDLLRIFNRSSTLLKYMVKKSCMAGKRYFPFMASE